MRKWLCPTDFSDASVDAIKYGMAFLSALGGGEIHIIHSIYYRQKTGMFIKMDEMLKENAEEDFTRMIKAELRDIPKNLKLIKWITLGDPAAMIEAYVKKFQIEMVIVGTRGSNALKEMTIGSVTQELIRKINIPIIAIPKDYIFSTPKFVVISVDDEPVEVTPGLTLLIKLVKHFQSKVHLCHIQDDESDTYAPQWDTYLKGLNYQFQALPKEMSVIDTINGYCRKVEADILCMIHRKQSFFATLFKKSHTKQKLFDLRIPLLVIHES